MAGIHAGHPFSLTRGGPFHHLVRRCGLLDGRGRVRWLWIVAVLWVPLVPAGLLQLVIHGQVAPIIRDPTMHVRLLVTIPLLFAAEQLLETRCQRAAFHICKDGVVDRATGHALFDRAERLRDAWPVELAIAVVVLALGQASLWGIGGWDDFVHAFPADARFSFVNIWCLGIALPMVQFLLLRWIWRWMIWTYVIARLSRQSLSLNAIHPDRAAGLKPLAGPIDAFAMFLTACISIAAAAWITEVRTHQATLQGLSPRFFAFLVGAIIVACAPLFLFSAQLYRARHRDAAAYHAFAREYADAFRRKWIGEAPHPAPLGTSDIQSLNDLGGSYERAEATRLYPFGMRALLNLCAGAFLPMLPLILTTTPITEIGKHMVTLVFHV